MALCLMSNYVIWSSRGVKTNCQKLATGCDASTNSATELLRTCYSRWCFNRHLLWYNTKPQRWKRMHFASENSGAVMLHATWQPQGHQSTIQLERQLWRVAARWVSGNGWSHVIDLACHNMSSTLVGAQRYHSTLKSKHLAALHRPAILLAANENHVPAMQAWTKTCIWRFTF